MKDVLSSAVCMLVYFSVNYVDFKNYLTFCIENDHPQKYIPEGLVSIYPATLKTVQN